MKRIAWNTLDTNVLRSTGLGLAAALVVACSAPPPPVVPTPPPPEPVATPAPPPPPPAPEPPPPEPEPLKLPGPIVFATGSDQLSSDSEPALKQVAAYLGQKANVTLLRIEGHTDNLGLKNRNQKLSEARALSVASWLIKNGVDCKRLIAVGFGDSKPVVENTDDDSRSKNRRTVFINAAVDGKELGGKAPDGGGQVAGDPCKK
jgi:OOP family OmpA-OmpF porin